jgi:hypothetical protein
MKNGIEKCMPVSKTIENKQWAKISGVKTSFTLSLKNYRLEQQNIIQSVICRAFYQVLSFS